MGNRRRSDRRARAERRPPPRAIPPAGLLGVGLIAVAVYAGALDNGFVWDDPIVVERQLPVFDSVSDVLFPPAGIPQLSPDYYRPLVFASYAVDHALSGDRPFAFHLSVVLAHALTSVLVTLLAAWMLRGVPYASASTLAAGLLFAVHPVHVESVAWVAGRSDVLATGFALAACLVHASDRISLGRAAAIGALVLLALASKETAIAVVPLLLVYEARVRRKGALPRAVAIGAGVGLYLLLRRIALGSWMGTAPVAEPAAGSAGDVPTALAFYAGKLLWPLPQNAYIDHVPCGIHVAIGTLALAVATGVVARCWQRERDGRPALLLLGFLLAIGPSLTIPAKIPDAPLAERYLYLPSVAFCLALAYAGARVLARASPARRRVLAGATALLLVAAATATVSRTEVWTDNQSLWRDTAAQSRRSGMPTRSLAVAELQRGRSDVAERLFRDALDLRDDRMGRHVVHNNLGTIAMKRRAWAAARRHFAAALEAVPGSPDVLFNLALTTFLAGGGGTEAARDALVHYDRALAKSPHDPDIHAGMGQAYAALGEHERARQHFLRALALGVKEKTARGIREYLPGEQEQH